MVHLLDFQDVILHELLHFLSPADFTPAFASCQIVRRVVDDEGFWFQVYCVAFRGNFAPPPTFRELEAGSLPELHLGAFSWATLVHFRSALVGGMPATDRLRGSLHVEEAPLDRAGMLDVEHRAGGHRRSLFSGSQNAAVLQQALQPLPLARKVAYVELLVNGGASLGLVSSADPEDKHIGWERGSIGYHGDEGSIYVSSGWSGRKFGPSFGLDPELAVPNDRNHAPRRADCIGLGIDYEHAEEGGDGADDPVASPLLFFTKNGNFIGSMRLPSPEMKYFAFALHRQGDQASLNVGTSRFYFDIEAYSQKPRPAVSLVLQSAQRKRTPHSYRQHSDEDDDESD